MVRPAYTLEDDGLVLTIRVTPNAAADRITGWETRDDGATVLRLRVTAPPDKGRANKAVGVLLAKKLGLARSAVTIVSGQTARQKTLRLHGDPARLAVLLETMR